MAARQLRTETTEADRDHRTVDRVQAGIQALQAASQKITAESLKQITRELEPGYAGVSFQVLGETHALTISTVK